MEKISTVSMVSWLNSWFDRTSLLMIEPYLTPKPNPTAKPNPIPCPKPNYICRQGLYLKYRIEFMLYCFTVKFSKQMRTECIL